MEEQVVFEQVLDTIVKRYGLEVRRPYNDKYIEIYRGTTMLGGMNYSGFSLLYNIGELYQICRDLVR